MIKAKFTGPGGQILKTKLPCHSLSLDSELRKIGAELPSRFLKLSDGGDSTVRMEFKPMNKVAGQLMQSFSGTGTLEDLNCAAQAVVHANNQIKPQLEQAVLQGRYPSLDSLLDGIPQLPYDAGTASETYYFPLTGTIWEHDSDEETEVGGGFLLGYAEKIQEHFATYMSGDTENMAFHYHGPGKDKLLLADWALREITTPAQQAILTAFSVIFYVASAFVLYFFARYMEEYLKLSGRARTWYLRSVRFVCLVQIFFAAVSPFTGAIFTVTETGYQRGGLFLISQLVPLYCYLLFTATVIYCRKRLTRREVKDVRLAGVAGNGITAVFLMWSYHYMPTGVATAIHFLYPVVVAFLMAIYNKERLPKDEKAGIVLAKCWV